MYGRSVTAARWRWLVVLAAAWFASTAQGHDSLAPLGAPHQWLPADIWLQRHWIPFDQRRLEQALGLRGRDLEAYLVNDHHTLADLARRRGVDVNRLADELVAPWRPTVTPTHLEMLRGRTMQILTQGHLAQHAFFHVYHSLGSTPVAEGLFGVSPPELDSRRHSKQTPLEVALEHGKDEAALTAGLIALLRSHRDTGVRLQEAWPAQSDRLLARQIRTLPCWLNSLRPSHDWGNPYGKAMAQHGPHARGWPATRAERALDEQRVERFWHRLRWTCWPRVPQWRWSGDAVAFGAVRWTRRPAPSHTCTFGDRARISSTTAVFASA
jgi:hypothetical protein